SVSVATTSSGPCGGGLPAVQNPPSGQVIAVSYTQSGVLLAQLREPALLWRGDTGATVSLSPDSRADTGHTIFHVNAGGGLACATCHAGTLLTNNTTVDVGTGQPLQVPSLRGVSWRAPLMHNGCAKTLADRFGDAACTGGDKHGVTSTLTAAQLGDLTAYLSS